MSGEIIADYFNANPDLLAEDKVINCVILTGQPGHQDAVLRTEFSQKAITDAGFTLNVLATDTANWQRVEAQDKMTAWLAAYDNIDCVLANNDDMALGAIEALKAAGYFVDGKYMPVVGVDATAPALEALKNGTLLGTVLNDAVNQGAATFNLAYALATGLDLNAENVGFELVDGRYIWVPYQKVTLDNYTEFE
jgi:methyl-galactoside transport system substrate-binding protein